MQYLLRTGRIIFAIGFAYLGILCFVYGDFIIGRPDAKVWDQFNPAMGYLGGAVIILCSIAILLDKMAKQSALAIAVTVFIFSLLRDLPAFAHTWEVLNAYKTIAFIGGALVIAASYNNASNNRRMLINTGCVLLAIFFIVGGYSHFKYAEFVEYFTPSYIPFRKFFAYFCGVCLIAGGIGIMIPAIRRWAALLSTIMLAGWFLLLHIPRLINNPADMSDRMGLGECFVFVGIFACLTGLVSKNVKSKM